MYLNQMFRRVMLESGQFLIPDQVVEVHNDRFKMLVDIVLGIYNNYSPHTAHDFINIASSRQFTFSQNSFPIPGSNPVAFLGVPDWITELLPVRISGVPPFFLTEYGRVGSELSVKKPFPWDYRKPVLTVPMSAEYDVHGVFYHKMLPDTVDGQPTWRIDTISENNSEFFKILTGKFLQALGRSRRAFTISELQVTTDAPDMISEGKQMEDEALQDLIDNKGKWYLAWR